MAALYADENFPEPTVLALRGLGHDVLMARDDGRGGQRIGDEFVLARAVQLDRAVLTFDRRDYRRIHRASAAHAGIVICTSDTEFDALARRIHVAVSAHTDLAGVLISVVKPNPAAGGP